MNKKAITLMFSLFLLASTQLACSLTAEESVPNEQVASLIYLVDQSGSSSGGNAIPDQPPSQSHNQSDPEICVDGYSASADLSNGEVFQFGEDIQAVLVLTNTGNCDWMAGYRLVMVGGDLNPAAAELEIPGVVSPGEKVQLEAGFSAPSQEGLYQSLWMLEDSQGSQFGPGDPPGAPLRIKIRVLPAANPQPTPSPTPTAPGEELTMLDDQCFDFQTESTVDCSDSSADFKYGYHGVLGGQLYKANNTIFGSYHEAVPDAHACENDAYAPLPHAVIEWEYLCFKIESIAATSYGWVRVTHFNESGLSFDFEILASDPAAVTAAPIPSPFVASQGEQLTLLYGECYDVWNGEINTSCSGIFAGFSFSETTKKSLQTAQIVPNETRFSAAMESKPSKSDCEDASYSDSPIWPIQETSYYCYQFVPGTTAYFGWLRPTSFNLAGMTFDFLTWESTP